MGNPHYSDEGFQCFNPAKNFQLNWYNPAKITEDPRVNGYYKTLTLVGIGEYNKALSAPIATATSADMSYPVTVRLETGGGADYFVGFNRAAGPNSLNDEGDNQVTIIQVDANNGLSYSQSFLRARLSAGQSHNLSNFGGTGKTVTITVNSINIATSPGKAVVTITDNTAPAPTNPPPPTAPVSDMKYQTKFVLVDQRYESSFLTISLYRIFHLYCSQLHHQLQLHQHLKLLLLPMEAPRSHKVPSLIQNMVLRDASMQVLSVTH
jgi:hypothetical protein